MHYIPLSYICFALSCRTLICCFMDDGLGKIKVISDHFNASTSSVDSQPNRTSSVSDPQIDNSSRYFILLEKQSVRI